MAPAKDATTHQTSSTAAATNDPGCSQASLSCPYAVVAARAAANPETCGAAWGRQRVQDWKDSVAAMADSTAEYSVL